MDGHQFDRFARAFGAGRSRRSVIKGLAATGLGTLLGARVATNASAQLACGVEDAECGETGEGIVNCCEGLTCVDGGLTRICIPEGTECSLEGEDCSESDCCVGMICDSGTCIYEGENACGVENGECGDTEIGPVECCDGLTCVDGGLTRICIPEGTVCSVEDEPCEAEQDCCANLTCISGSCISEDDNACVAENEACGSLGGDGLIECCDGLTCVDTDGIGGTCSYVEEEIPYVPEVEVIEVTSLPATGAGQAADGASWVVPAALGAAAAAVIGGKLLKNTTATDDLS